MKIFSKYLLLFASIILILDEDILFASRYFEKTRKAAFIL